MNGVPPGAIAPTAPVTVAVYVIVPPKMGVAGELVTLTLGAALVMTKEIGAGAVAEE